MTAWLKNTKRLVCNTLSPALRYPGVGDCVTYRGIDKWLSRLALNQVIVGSNPTPATSRKAS